MCKRTENLSEAWNVLSEMQSSGVIGNVRTLNTLLRGCLLHGDATKAFEIFINMSTAGCYFNEMKKQLQQQQDNNNDDQLSAEHHSKKSKNGKGKKHGELHRRCDADASSYEYLICLLSHALRLDDASIIADLRFYPHPSQQTNSNYRSFNNDKAGGGKSKSNESNVSVMNCDMTKEEDDGFIDLHLARGYAMLSNWSQCHKHLVKVENIIQRVTSSSSSCHGITTPSERDSGGRRSKKAKFSGSEGESGGRDNSNKNFRSHRHEVSSDIYL